ncbi:PD-(D/E)XK nuclease family protein [Halomicrococcus sp. SG-WS-1]|uniref:PD-(D/E)XK nuclease family protein n=1 Tax=Halomicrococcus sp. SG-WS-1 TaxID=3439057 RepID=UPI003F79E579
MRRNLIDYKTDSLANRDVDELAEHYWPQLRVYACALQQANPKAEVMLRLVFTDGNEIHTEFLRNGDVSHYRAKYEEILKDRS